MNQHQRTLMRPVSCTGIGLHSGRTVNLCLRPAETDTGVMFKRSDLPASPLIPADVNHVVSTDLSTTVGMDGVTISTVEHLLSALSGLGVDNVLVEVDAPEIPIMDGSAAPFVFLMRGAGFTSQGKPRQYYRVKREVEVSENGKSIKVSPNKKLKVDFTIEFEHPLIHRQKMGFVLDERGYDKEISRARTFGFLRDMRYLHENGLALGGSLDNAVVLDNYQVLNEDGLRFPDEFVRHKVLDFIGDLAMVGRPIVGAFTAHKSGHALNNRLFRKFLADPTAWELVTPSLKDIPEFSQEPLPLFDRVAATA
ncbi:MAG: UDP-3-O-acyl-N-acetylglucosamine deacetylase [Proteobacteria bacterium]|nr:UDP-3-O-acyl-N-acetylglucosamine deacetylase [Pseudomonadota bacterium]MBU4384341.1 UDP-3-O-acyl-N-acetylglucosamine deacetylase [Pseudomonadota bacterium]MBU4606321.1 UDP-3-O-acyl-N-acetylglucosamine deacetylase [Pseudomonadota bacterium]